jgi:outer membrane protein OmpA-like peptidoglycan-associated protein/outer membrane protein W
MMLKKSLLAATILALPLAAHAQQMSGLYIGLGAGLNLPQQSSASVNIRGAAAGTTSGRFDFDWEPAFVVSLGYAYGNGLRAEVEFSYRQNDATGSSGFGLPGAANTGGRLGTFGFMLNGFYDFDVGPGSWITPYVGAGVGFMRVSADDIQRGVIAGAATSVTQFTQGEWVFGYQAIIGAAFPVPAVSPNFSLTAEYRYMATLDAETNAARFTAGGVARGSGELSNQNHAIFIGARYSFGAAPPPAPAPVAAAPAPARTFLVFFDWDRADLTDRARQIIAEAAQSAQSTGTTRIEVSGHADRSGTPQYNQRLSERRANAVAAELERRGVPRSAMVIQAFGETRPLVPTADGVREPQNRRVEIVLR